MGICKSKIPKPDKVTPDSMLSSHLDDYEDVELMLLRKIIKRDPESFILNNLMMCVQFFENYEEDILQIKDTLVSSNEAKLNKVLPPQKHVLLPDVLQENVKVAFTSTRQTVYPTIEPLQPVRIYVVHDNIEITEQHYPPEYSSVNNAVTYNMLLKPTQYRGYVRLKLLDETPYPKSPAKKEHIYFSSEYYDETCSDGDSIYVPKPNSKTAFPKQIKKSDVRTSKIPSARSLPNLRDDEIIHEEDQAYHSQENIYQTRSGHNIKTESDYEHTSSTSEDRREHIKKIWSKSELATKAGSHQRLLRAASPTKLKKLNSRSPASSTSSGYRSGNYAPDSDSDSSYHVMKTSSTRLICNANRDAVTTQHNSPQSCTAKTTADASAEVYSMSNARIPQRCFKKVIHTRDGKIYDPRDERRQQNSKQRRIVATIRQRNYEVSYLNSAEFMTHFINIFQKELGQLLGFNREDLTDTKLEGSVIYCDKMELHNSRLCRIESFEITPTIWLQWPECAQEWLDRPRISWPSDDDVNKIKDFGCYVIPEGFEPKRGSNIHQDIDWQLVFPAAERYLETCMSRSQIQVYLIALMLHKTFIRPVFDTMYGLTTSHIRNKMFWLIEEDNSSFSWPDNRVGECLIKLLKNLYRCLSQNEPTLFDYFVRDKNVFQKVPCDHLLHTQKQLKRIIENPIMYVFHAMENIRHSEKFFPRLNYELLLDILTIDTLALLNPALGAHMFASSSRTHNSSRDTAKEEIYNKSGGFWINAKVQTKQKVYNTRVVTNKTLINPRKATDSIIEISVRCAELEGPRLGALLNFFIGHFIKMAERCHQYRAYQQKKIYLDQADRLSIILSEMARYKDDAKTYRNKINALRIKTTSSRSQEEPPETPKRNIEAPLFVGTLKNRFTQETTEIMTESGDKQLPSIREDHREIATAVVHEIRSKDKEKIQTKAETNDEDISILRKPVSKDENQESASGTIQRVVSLMSNQNESFLSETTYI